MANTTLKGNLFPAKIVSELINNVEGESGLAKMSSEEAVPFNGKEYMTLSMDGEANIVGEGEAKPAGDASLGSKILQPVKFEYQHRITDEFMHASDEERIPYLREFALGFGRKIARGMDIAAIYGVNPGNGQDASFKATNSFAKAGIATGAAAAADDALRAGIAEVKDKVNGIIMSPTMAAQMGSIKANGLILYPEFDFGGTPDTFKGKKLDVTDNIEFAEGPDALVGNFDKFRWGYAKDITFDIIPYGDPDGQGDLKRYNQIVLRAEAYIGWTILDDEAFAKVTVE
jgi:HK97 family phage major capsid protein